MVDSSFSIKGLCGINYEFKWFSSVSAHTFLVDELFTILHFSFFWLSFSV